VSGKTDRKSETCWSEAAAGNTETLVIVICDLEFLVTLEDCRKRGKTIKTPYGVVQSQVFPRIAGSSMGLDSLLLRFLYAFPNRMH
jgi:hypothetical protein